MADGQEVAEVQEVSAPEQQQADNKAYLDQQMSLALGIHYGSQGSEQVQETVNENQTETTTTTEEPIVVPEFKFDIFKEKGFNTPDEVFAQLEELKSLKEKPLVAEHKFENEASKKLYEAYTKGDKKQVVAILAQQEKLEELSSLAVNDDTAPTLIKYGMKLKYKTLSDEQIDYKFNKTFGLPKEPSRNSFEDVEEYNEAKADWDEKVKEVRMERQIEAATFKPDIENAKEKLVLPEIEQNVDQGYQQYLKELEESKATDAQTIEAYKVFGANDAKLSLAFIDESNKINSTFDFTPDEQSVKTAKEWVTDMDKFYANYRNPDGSPNRKKFFADMTYLATREKTLQAAINFGKNAYIKAQLPDNQKTDLTRQVTQETGMSELDKMMLQAGIKRGS